MSIHYRPDRRLPWQVRWREEGAQRARSFPGPLDPARPPKVALRFEAEVASRLAMGAHAPGEPSRMTLEEWCERWIDVHSVAWEDRTRRDRAWMGDKHLLPFLGGVRLRDLGRARILTFRRDALAAGRSPMTVNAAMRVLSACLAGACEEGLVPANPALGIRPLPRMPVERRAIPLGDVERIREGMCTTRDRLIVSLLVYAGLRPGELVALRAQDVGEATLHVSRAAGQGGRTKATKTRKGRVIPIREELRRDLPHDLDEDGLLVRADRGGRIDWHNWVQRVWRPIVRGLELDYIPYEGRHTYASLLIAEGHTIVEVSTWMGHASATTTLDHYGHLMSAHAVASSRRST